MKKLFLILCLAGIACVPARAQQAKTPKVVTVNVEGVFDKYQKVVDRRKSMEADARRYQESIEMQKRSLEALQSEAQKAQAEAQNLSLSEQGRANAKNLLEAKARQFMEARNKLEAAVQDASRVMEQRQKQLLTDVLEDLRTEVAKVAADKGADLVIGSATLLYANPALDVSKDVIDRLNAGYTPFVPATTPAPAAAAAPPATATPAAPAPAAKP